MGRSAHVCRGEVCPCYKCSVCGAQWLHKNKLISHQKFSDCRLVLTVEEKKHDLREATAPSATSRPVHLLLPGHPALPASSSPDLPPSPPATPSDSKASYFPLFSSSQGMFSVFTQYTVIDCTRLY